MEPRLNGPVVHPRNFKRCAWGDKVPPYFIQSLLPYVYWCFNACLLYDMVAGVERVSRMSAG